MNSPGSRLRPEIRDTLNNLRDRIRRYVAIEGLALVVIVMGVLFWISIGLDAAWFKVNKLELPSWFRTAFTVIAVCALVVTFLVWVVSRCRGKFDNKNLALVMERQFPQLNDRLITSVEAAQIRSENPSELSNAMLDRTVDDVSRLARELPVETVFKKRPMRRALIGAGVLVASVFGFGVLNAQAMGRWWDAYIVGADTYWERDTQLTVKVISQPGDRVREFEERSGQMVYRHARGADLALLIEVPTRADTNAKGEAGSDADGEQKPWAIPERVRLDTRRTDGGRSRVFLAASGEREYRFTINQLQDTLRIWVQGNDFTNRLPYVVTIVDPPRVDSVTLNCNYPAYTGLNETGTQAVAVNDAQVTIPIGTEFGAAIQTNKPLNSYRLQTDAWELIADREDCRLVIRSEDGLAEKTFAFSDRLRSQLFQFNATEFSVPMVLSSDAQMLIDELESPIDSIPLAADSLMRIYVEDEDEITSTDPARLTINGRVDSPPMVDVRRRGISDVITRKAVIPITGRVSDDYGVANARFEFRVDDEQDWRPRPFRKPPGTGVESFTLQRDEQTEWEQFEVLPLDMDLGQKLTLTVFAEDADNLNGPHESRSEQFTFKIVSNEELLSLLYSREVNLRRRFEQIIREVERTRDDLTVQASRSGDTTKDVDNNPTGKSGRSGLSAASVAVRSQGSIRKNANETLSVAQSFGEILEELVNNAVHTRQMVGRINELIVEPLAEINEQDFPRVDEAIGAFRVKTELQQDSTAAAAQSVAACDTLIRHMQTVLSEIQDLAEFHEALGELKNMIEAQKKVMEDTKDAQKKQLIERLK